MTSLSCLLPLAQSARDILPVDWDQALTFSLMAAPFVIAYPKNIFIGAALTVLGAGVIELLHLLLPSRHMHFEDSAVKAAGGLVSGWVANRVLAMRKV